MTKSSVLVDVQNALSDESEEPPSARLIADWATIAYSAVAESPTEVTIRLVDEPEMVTLNETYRGKLGTTNVLSFPFENDFDQSIVIGDSVSEPLSVESSLVEPIPDLLGDIVICHNVILNEAREQKKTVLNHYAHMVTHGMLHLCGYDHLNDDEAEEMEALEVKILAQSHIDNPYT